MITLSGISHHDVIDVWPSVLPYIERAMEDSGDDFTVEYVLGRIVDGEYKLWIGHNDKDIYYVGVTRLEYFDATGKLVCLVMWLAGDDLDSWKDSALSQLESWAMDNDCDELRITGRAGWERVFKESGFRKTHTILSKSLGNKQ